MVVLSIIKGTNEQRPTAKTMRQAEQVDVLARYSLINKPWPFHRWDSRLKILLRVYIDTFTLRILNSMQQRMCLQMKCFPTSNNSSIKLSFLLPLRSYGLLRKKAGSIALVRMIALSFSARLCTKPETSPNKTLSASSVAVLNSQKPENIF